MEIAELLLEAGADKDLKGLNHVFCLVFKDIGPIPNTCSVI